MAQEVQAVDQTESKALFFYRDISLRLCIVERVLWVDFWFLIDSLGPGVDIVKCKGHANLKDVDEGRSTMRTMIGNNAADVYAVRGTEAAIAI